MGMIFSRKKYIWLENRIILVLFSLIDFFGVIFLSSYFFEPINSNNIVLIFLYATNLIVFNYVFGRYFFKINFKFVPILRDLTLCLLSNAFSVFFSFLYIYSLAIKDVYPNQLFGLFFINFICNSILNFIYKLPLEKYSSKEKFWFLICDQEIETKISRLLNILNNRIKVIKDKKEFFRLNKSDQIEGIVFDQKYVDLNLFEEVFIECKLKGMPLLGIDKWHENILEMLNKIYIDEKINSFKDNLIQNIFKRIGDIFVSFILLIPSIPIILISAFAIKIEDNGPVFYYQVRNGKNLKHFNLVKLRSMKINAEKNGPQWSKKNDERVTRVGKFLRKYRIDELPQLISVIKGEMSLIGPRPERIEIDENLIGKINKYSFRYAVKPGLTGWAQVNYPYGASFEDAKIKLAYDLFYIKKFSTLLDFFIFFKTIKIIICARNSSPKG